MQPRIYISMAMTLTAATLFCCTSCSGIVYAEDTHSKRAPSGFTGVRGKKSIPDSAYTDSNPDTYKAADTANDEDATSDITVVEKRAPSGFMGMRGKKPWEGTYPEDGVYKRGPSGFFGMRGKKDMETVAYNTDGFYKRAPSGFMGMRGKKPYDDYYGSKRASMGFVGMRGKKYNDDTDDLLDEEKRAPSGFFGMRGKKLLRQQSGFFGMRGKKYPYEFRGKFVGVRGKKMANDFTGPDYYEDSLDKIGQDLDINQLMLLLTEQHDNSIDNGAWKNYDSSVIQ